MLEGVGWELEPEEFTPTPAKSEWPEVAPTWKSRSPSRCPKQSHDGRGTNMEPAELILGVPAAACKSKQYDTMYGIDMGLRESSRCQYVNIMTDAVRNGTNETHPRYRPMLLFKDWPQWNSWNSSQLHPGRLETERAFNVLMTLHP